MNSEHRLWPVQREDEPEKDTSDIEGGSSFQEGKVDSTLFLGIKYVGPFYYSDSFFEKGTDTLFQTIKKGFYRYLKNDECSLFRSTRTLKPEILEALNDDERSGWKFVAGRDKVTSGELMTELGFDERKAQRGLKKLMKVNLIHRVGKGRATHYEVVRP